MMEDLQIELNRLDAKGADWERLALYGIRFRCETCRYGRQKDFWFSCLRDRKDYPGGHVCDAWEGKERKS
jgi:hypothetical protein